MGTRAIFLLAIALVGCGGKLVASPGEVQLAAVAIDFGATWVGYRSIQPVVLRNEARSSRTAQLKVSAPFVLSQSTLEVPGGAIITVPLSLTADTEGALEGVLTLGDSSIPVSAFARPPPVCTAPATCHQVAFDPVSGSCVDALEADGTSCGGDACVENGRCVAGVCKGGAQTCDDANACTADSCGDDGCIHSEVSCPAALDPCQVPRCDPKTGCATQEAPDGTRCGAGDCNTAHVCMSGACVVRPVPDGAVCGDATPCAAAPTCQSGACTPSPPRPMTELWSYAPANGSTILSFGSQDPKGNLYFLEAAGMQYALVSLTRDGALRFKVAVGQWATLGPIDVANQQILIVSKHRTIQARSLADGHLGWSVDCFDAMKPLFDRGPGATYNFSIFDTTLVSAAAAVLDVHEDGGPWRSWAVGVSLTTGQLLWNREHPGHLSSFVADAKGDVFYVESTGWGGTQTLFARDAAGAQRWTRTLPPNQYASVLSLVDGALLYRGLNGWLDATNGSPLGTLGTMDPGGLSVGNAGTAWVVSTCPGATCGDSVRAYDVRTHQPLWQLPVGDGISELLLASRGIVLAITAPKAVYPALASSVVGLDGMGVEVFRCKTAEALDPSPVLDDGQLVGRLGNRIAALALPKLGPAPSGWISSRGNFLRTGRAR